jgi:RNA polymerase sigma-70 factor (ECF subfamily)
MRPDDPAVQATPPGPDLLFDRYARRLVALASARLDARLKSKVDAEDVVQSVFRTFCRRLDAGLVHSRDEAGLWKLLARITARKCHSQADLFFAASRDVRREAVPTGDNSSVTAPPEASDPGPTPDEAVALVELVDRLRAELSSERKRQILDLTLQGYTVAEISDRVGFYERGVERVRAEIRQRLQELLS